MSKWALIPVPRATPCQVQSRWNTSQLGWFGCRGYSFDRSWLGKPSSVVASQKREMVVYTSLDKVPRVSKRTPLMLVTRETLSRSHRWELLSMEACLHLD